MSIEELTAHPYADEFPYASDEELDELTESVATVGLIHPLLVVGKVAGVADGRLADGRNRLAACRRAGVDPDIETRDFDTDDELKEFVIGVNTTGRRDSMSVQVAAASSALILGEAKRINGQWRRGSLGGDFRLTSGARSALQYAGFVLDVLGRDRLAGVRDGAESLNAAYEAAKAARESEKEALQHEERIQAEEDDARTYLEGTAPEYLDKYSTARQAFAAWEDDNRREAARIRQERQAEERRAREYEKEITRTYSTIARAVQVLQGYGRYSDNGLDEVMADYSPDRLDPKEFRTQYGTENLGYARRFLDYLINWTEE